MYAVTKGDITIRQMRGKDIISLIKTAQLSKEAEELAIRELKKEICERKEGSNLIFTILYHQKVVGKIDLLFTDEYGGPRFRGIKTGGNLIIEIPNAKISSEIIGDVLEMFIAYCKEIALVDTLGIPRRECFGMLMWNPIEIMPVSESA